MPDESDQGPTHESREVRFSGGAQLCFTLEPDGTIRTVTQASNVGERWDTSQFVGQNIVDLARNTPGSGDRPEQWIAWLAAARRDHEPKVYVDVRESGYDGMAFATIETTVIPVVGPGGVVDAIAVWVKDETEARAAAAREQAMRDATIAREQRAQLEAALSMTGLGRYLFSFRDRRLDVDDRFNEIIGRDAATLFGNGEFHRFVDLIHEDDLEPMRETIAHAMAGEPYAIEYRLWWDTPNGRELRWVSALGRIESDDDGPVRMFGLIEDITERRQEDALRIRVQKLEAISTLAGGIAHDFNNVISAILSNAEVAQYELAAGESADTSLVEIRRGAERAADLVRGLLSFSREEAPSAVAFDLGEIVAEACALLQAGLPPAIELRPALPEAPLTMVGEPSQLHQVVMNLVTNAQQALGPGGGRIDVALTALEVHGDDAPLGLQPGPHLRLVVTDDGPGIEPATQLRIFDPFFTTKRRGEGTGLGLAATQTIVRNHGGVVTVESTPGAGAAFTAVLPVGALATTARAKPRPAGFPTASGDPAAARLRVMFVDDERALTRLARRALAVEGCDARAYTDPLAALAAFQAAPDDVDVLITDLSMPGLTGIELSRAMRAIRPGLPVVLSWGFISSADELDLAGGAIDAVVPKPCSMRELATAARELMKARRTSPA